ncbi:hypothetical protein ACFPN4_14225 [Ureibacillus thermophilus]|uniref:hypothetical protein n=1 Tax=Ureibacillus thermophilus TaxID=367743 RepID=UPI003621870B
MAPYVLDQFGQPFSKNSTDYKYESLDPTVLVVNSSTGEITPISAGTARVKITSGNFSKVITVEVKAASELKELAVSTDNVSLSDKSPAQAITVTAKDQYGDSFNVTGITIEKNDPNGVINLSSTTVNSGSSFTITPVAGKEGTATITLKKGTVTKTINVTVTKADSTVAGYKAVIASDSVSKDFEIDKAKTSVTDQDNTVKLELYAVDANGNIVNSTPVNATWKVKDYTNGFVTIDNDTNTDGITDSAVSYVTVTAIKAGTVTLVPVVGGLELSPVTITVKDSTVNLASVAVKRTTVNVNQSAGNAWSAVHGNLEGTGTDGKAKTVTAADIKAVYSSDSSVVDSAINLSTSPTMTIHKAGRTTVTVVFKDELKLNPVAFTLNVVDDVAPDKPSITAATVKGGTDVTIADVAEGVTAWLAPAGTTNFVEGANMTKLVGTSGNSDTTIKAPTAEGTYYLYLVDAAGNVSQPSTNAITVDNTAPTDAKTNSVTVTNGASGDLKAYEAGDVITIKFSEEVSVTEVIKLSNWTVTGTPAGNLDDSTITAVDPDGDNYADTFTITLKNSSSALVLDKDGANDLKIAKDKVVDRAGNAATDDITFDLPDINN